MRAILTAVLGLGLVWAAASPAADKDEPKATKLEGKITCAKCDLGKATSCATVIVVKEKDKEVVYWFDADAHKKYHGKVCTEPHKGTVQGTIKKDGDKMVVTVKELKFTD